MKRIFTLDDHEQGYLEINTRILELSRKTTVSFIPRADSTKEQKPRLLHMHTEIIKYCSAFVNFSSSDKDLIVAHFKPVLLKRKSFLLQSGEVCEFIAFVNSGIIRHFHIKDGNEITCDITLPGLFITDFKSFTQSIPSNYFFQVLKDAQLLMINKKDILELYETNKNFEKLGRIMAEKVAQRTIDIAMSLSSDKPEERVNKLITNQPELFQLVPQRYLANLLGISPESLSRIKSRK